jgi:hypothetical protein
MSYTSWVFDSLYVLRWGDRPDVADVAAYSGEIAAASKAQGKPLVGLIIMPPSSAAPDENFRKAQAKHLPGIFTNLDYAICVFEGTGFFAAVKRSALLAILMVSRKRFPVYVRSTIEDALLRDPPKPLPFDAARIVAELQQQVAA